MNIPADNFYRRLSVFHKTQHRSDDEDSNKRYTDWQSEIATSARDETKEESDSSSIPITNHTLRDMATEFYKDQKYNWYMELFIYILSLYTIYQIYAFRKSEHGLQ